MGDLALEVKDISICAAGRGFNSLAGQIGHSSAIAATFLRSCVAEALSRGDGPRHSLRDSA